MFPQALREIRANFFTTDAHDARGLAFKEENVIEFIDNISHVGKKKGSILVQFPASTGINCYDQFAHLLEVIRSRNTDGSWKIAFEFRNASWYHEEVYELIESYAGTVVFHDKARTASKHHGTHADVVYLRFHGPQGDYRGSYPDDVLHEHAEYIVSWLREGKQVFVYFNNTMGKAFDNLTTLNNHVTDYYRGESL